MSKPKDHREEVAEYGATNSGIVLGTARRAPANLEALRQHEPQAGNDPLTYAVLSAMPRARYRAPRAFNYPVGSSTVTKDHWIRNILLKDRVDSAARSAKDNQLWLRHASLHFDVRYVKINDKLRKEVDTCDNPEHHALIEQWRNETPMSDPEKTTAGASDAPAEETAAEAGTPAEAAASTADEAASNEAAAAEAEAGEETAAAAESEAEASAEHEADAAAADEQASEAQAGSPEEA